MFDVVPEGVDRDGFFTAPELEFIGFSKVGKNCRISRKSSFYAISGSIGDNVRIDDFCILKGRVVIGSYVHINSHNMISGAKAPVTFKGFTGTGVGVSIFTGSDDHRSRTLNNATVMAIGEPTDQIEGPVTIGLGTIIGTYVTILPNIKIGDGASVGANCVVSFDIPDGGIVRPAKTELLEKRRDFERIKELAFRVLENDEGSV